MPFWFGLIRGLHLGASILVAASYAFRIFVTNRCFPGCERDLGPVFANSSRWITIGSWFAVVTSGLIWLLYVAASMAGTENPLELTPALLISVLEKTQFGRIWAIRFLIAIFLGSFLLIKRYERVGGFLAFALLLSLAGAGHAGAQASGFFLLVSDALHLAATAFWPGGLVFLGILLYDKQPIPSREQQQLVFQCACRFSRQSLIVVGLLAGTGIVNAWLLVGSIKGLYTTDYGRILVLKVCVFIVMLILGAQNFFLLRRGSPQNGPSKIASTEDLKTQSQILMKNVVFEQILFLGVVILTGFLGGAAPPGA